MIRKADIILAAALIVVGLAVSLALFAGGEKGRTVAISVDGKSYASYPLTEERTVTIKRHGHTNKITIKGGQVAMAFSDCANQDCVHRGKISSTAESIVCLPNRVVVEITGGEADYDAVAR